MQLSVIYQLLNACNDITFMILTCDFGPFPRTSFHWISLIMFMVSILYVVGWHMDFGECFSHLLVHIPWSSTPSIQFYIHGTVAAILWSDACMQMYSGESCIASHTWQWDDSEPMYAINQSHGTVAAILWKNGPTGDVNAWCMHRWIDRADQLAEAVAWVACCVSLYIYIYI